MHLAWSRSRPSSELKTEMSLVLWSNSEMLGVFLTSFTVLLSEGYLLLLRGMDSVSSLNLLLMSDEVKDSLGEQVALEVLCSDLYSLDELFLLAKSLHSTVGLVLL